MKDRIEENEKIYNDINGIIERLEKDLDDFESNKKSLSKLKRYYGSNKWFKDKEAFETGKISNIKAGVLSEDLVWNMLEDLGELIKRMKKITKRYHK